LKKIGFISTTVLFRSSKVLSFFPLKRYHKRHETELDVAFLSFYAVVGMCFSGHLGDRTNLRIFLTEGMVGTGLFTLLFSVGYWGNIHSFLYYLIVQMIAGLFQTTGWPSVVAVVGTWSGKSKRGLIMGIWNAHTSIGNITGPSPLAPYHLKMGFR
jgi:OPA family glycerol-3-phosphate transporter-like MFS transporter 1/2